MFAAGSQPTSPLAPDLRIGISPRQLGANPMKLAALTALMAATLSAPALAAEWVDIGTNVNNTKYKIDIKSIRTMSNGYKRAWIQAIYELPTKFGDTSSKTYYEYDCNLGRFRGLSSVNFSGDKVSTTESNVDNWTYSAPESMAEFQLKLVCRK
jgi:surface antigen